MHPRAPVSFWFCLAVSAACLAQSDDPFTPAQPATEAHAGAAGADGWSWPITDAVLWDNGPLVTTPTCSTIAPLGQQSEVQFGNSNAGTNVNIEFEPGNDVYLVADDFSNSVCWEIERITWFAYQSMQDVPINSGLTRIYNGDPSAGGRQIAGSPFASSVSNATGIYRTFNLVGQPLNCNTSRPLYTIETAFNPPLQLQPGTYWLGLAATLTAGASGPFTPHVTITGQLGKPGANGLRRNVGGVWEPVWGQLNPPSNQQDVPFIIEGSICPPCAGDIDGDGSTCQPDLNLLLAAFNACPGDSGYNPAANLGGDACINQDDLNVLLANFNCGVCQ